MEWEKILEGVIIGGVGGTIAGLTVWITDYLHKKFVKSAHMERVYKWLSENISNEDGNRHRSTRAIASHNNLTEDSVRYVCSEHEEIYLSTGKEEDLWGIYGIGRCKPGEKP